MSEPTCQSCKHLHDGKLCKRFPPVVHQNPHKGQTRNHSAHYAYPQVMELVTSRDNREDKQYRFPVACGEYKKGELWQPEQPEETKAPEPTESQIEYDQIIDPGLTFPFDMEGTIDIPVDGQMSTFKAGDVVPDTDEGLVAYSTKSKIAKFEFDE